MNSDKETMHALNVADKSSARLVLLLGLACLVRPAAVESLGRHARDLNVEGSANNNNNNNNNLIKNSIVITPKFSGLDCDFEGDGDCLWTWDSDNFTSGPNGFHRTSIETILPGQNGFYRTSGEEMSANSKNFFGSIGDPSGSKKGKQTFFIILFFQMPAV